ncbi:hypothetical protein [Paludibacterium purpuratum]|uniref:Uncharacterized protein n=1 Tax=Paludibacterium purpuratum TaxID=1144873 RepID=A0A4R7B5U2_9NEIS|nr:hypothetical protein [Paludibacterium purpuratum]TDR79988.1 hypothetical protein DFP86_106128 [Paludibacterium purpuratum]
MTTGIRSDASGVMGALQIGGADVMQFTNNGSSGSISPFTASVNANAITGVLAPYPKVYRSLAQSGGPSTQTTNTASLWLTVPSGATLGSTNGNPSMLVWLSLWNGATESLGVVNITSGSINLDESLLISTTAIGTGANSAGVVYSSAALTNAAFKIVGMTTVTQVTAGAWASAPTVGSGVGGFAGENLIGLGVGQTWQNVVASRVAGAIYYNTTGRPIIANVAATLTSAVGIAMTINGTLLLQGATLATATIGGTWLIPPGAWYSLSSNGVSGISVWAELR